MFRIYKSVLKVGVFALMLIFLSSCEEVIDIDLDSSDPALVIDGEIMLNQNATVTISYTTDYFNPDDAVFENEATVVLENSDNESEILTFAGDGVYIGSEIIGKVGRTYTLSVELGNKEYTANTVMLTPTSIVALTPEESSRGMGSTKNYELNIEFTNNITEENYYLIKYLYQDDDGQQEDYSTLSWEFFAQDEVIDYSGMRTFEEGTVVDVEMYSIDEGTYEYYSDLGDINGERSRGSSIPYNPVSNFGSDVLGYFRAWSVDKSQIVMPE